MPLAAATQPDVSAALGGVHLVFDDADFATLAATLRQVRRTEARRLAEASLCILVQRSAASQLNDTLGGLGWKPPFGFELFDEETDGVRRANAAFGTPPCRVWSNDVARAFRVASGFSADAIWINDWGRIAYGPTRSHDSP